MPLKPSSKEPVHIPLPGRGTGRHKQMKQLPGTPGMRLPFHFKLQQEHGGSQTLMHEYRGKVRGPLLILSLGNDLELPA